MKSAENRFNRSLQHQMQSPAPAPEPPAPVPTSTPTLPPTPTPVKTTIETQVDMGRAPKSDLSVPVARSLPVARSSTAPVSRRSGSSGNEVTDGWSRGGTGSVVGDDPGHHSAPGNEVGTSSAFGRVSAKSSTQLQEATASAVALRPGLATAAAPDASLEREAPRELRPRSSGGAPCALPSTPELPPPAISSPPKKLSSPHRVHTEVVHV